ncbi:MAG: Penicillin-binding protein, partial [Acidimicrobiia bacterium]|nr:Penicillin-binding protein [Acidimicrobiia bacterium]
GALVVAVLPQIATLATAHTSTASVPDLSPVDERSVMFDAAGRQIGVFKAEQNRVPVALAEVPLGVVQAVLAVEDANFYDHAGVNLRAVLRATLASASAGDTVQGGSTITQQVVKNRILGGAQRKKEAGAKLKEAMYALRLEDKLTKNQILEEYLNTVYFGNGAYGVSTAADVYFGKPLSKLTLADGAFLAGLIRNPMGYDPFLYPVVFQERRKFALQRLVETHKMTQAEADLAAAVPLPKKAHQTVASGEPNSYFAEEAKQQILDDPAVLGLDSATDRNNELFRGGLKIYTTMNPVLQQNAEDAVYSTLAKNKIPDPFSAALASIDPRDGAVRALVGGPSFQTQKFDLATQGWRQGGSSFKTFVLLAALEAGAQPDDVLNGGKPCSFLLDRGQANYEPGGHTSGTETISEEFADSVNCAFVRLGQAVGVNNAINVAVKMGINDKRHPIPAVASMPLGTGEVTPLALASAYGVLATGGVRHDPYYIERIEDRDGNIIYRHSADSGKRVIDANIANVAVDVMKGPIRTGTAADELANFSRPAAGKTGTSEDSADAWFTGFTPELSTSVWMGSAKEDDPATPENEARKPMVNLGNFKSVVGGGFPARIWGLYMEAALTNVPPSDFPAFPADARRPERIYAPGAECIAPRFVTSKGKVVSGAILGNDGLQPQKDATAGVSGSPTTRPAKNALPVFDPGTGTPPGQPLPMVPINSALAACGAPIRPVVPGPTTTVPGDATSTSVPGSSVSTGPTGTTRPTATTKPARVVPTTRPTTKPTKPPK